MSGNSALRGYRYQLLRTLEYVFDAFRKELDFTSVWAEAPRQTTAPNDIDIIDFALVSETERMLVAQVKSSITSRSIGASAIVRSLVRLVKSGRANSYVFLTNQRPSESAKRIAELLAGVDDLKSLRAKIAEEVGSSPSLPSEIRKLTYAELAQLRLSVIQFDTRSDDELHDFLKASVRFFRRGKGVSTGPLASGLVVDHLVSLLFEAASAEPAISITAKALRSAMDLSATDLMQTLRRREAARIFGSLPRVPDIPRPEIVEEIHQAVYGINHGIGPAPCCVLAGPSGIGKSSLSVEYITEYSDLYELVYWIDASSTVNLRSGFEHLLSREQPDLPQLTSDSGIQSQVHSLLASMLGRWLLIIDGAADRSTVERWIPSVGNGASLVSTTEKLGWSGPQVSVVDVPTMTDEQASKFVELRLLKGGEPMTPSREAAFKKVANVFENWPLALELGLNYISSCQVTIDESWEFARRFRQRALADEQSTPIGYPRTLTRALRMSFERLTERAREDAFSEIVLCMIRFAAYTQSRGIPIDMLLQAASMNPVDATERGFFGPASWDDDDYPLPEILRAVDRDFLLRIDQPLDFRLDQLKPAVQINEIVQQVVRNFISDTDPTGDTEHYIIFSLSFYLQSWIVWFIERDGIVALGPLLPHAEHVANAGLRRERKNFGLAVLWGNLATVMQLQERPKIAVQYLEAELEFLEAEPRNREELRIQTRISLAGSLWEVGPGSSIELTARIYNLISESRQLLQELGSEESVSLRVTMVAARQLLRQLSRHSLAPAGLPELEEFFKERIGQFTDDPDDARMRPAVLLDLIERGEVSRAQELAQAWLNTAYHDGLLRPVYLRILAEAHAVQCQWGELREVLQALRREVRLNRLNAVDASSVVVNVGSVLTMSLCIDDPDGSIERDVVGRILSELIGIADEHELFAQDFNEADNACLTIMRAADACGLGAHLLQDRYLFSVSFDALRVEDPLRLVAWREAFQLVAFMVRPEVESAGDFEGQAHAVDASSEPNPAGEVTDFISRLFGMDEGRNWFELLYDPADSTVTVGFGEADDPIRWSLFRDGRFIGGLLICQSARVVGIAGCLVAVINGLPDATVCLVEGGRVGALRPLRRYFNTSISDSDHDGTESPTESIADKLGVMLQEEIVGKQRNVFVIVDASTGVLLDNPDLADYLLGVSLQYSALGLIVTSADLSLHALGGSQALRRTLRSQNLMLFVD